MDLFRVRRGRRPVHLRADRERAAGEPCEAVMACHFSAAVLPGTRLVVAIAPGLTIGFVRPSLCSTAESQLNGKPVPLTPSLLCASSGPIASHTRAKTNGFDTLMIVNSTSASPAA